MSAVSQTSALAESASPDAAGVRRSASLNTRLLAAIALVVALGAVSGVGLAVLLERKSLREELSAAMIGGREHVAVLMAGEGGPAAADPARIVKSLDGDRHMSLRLVAPDGAVLARSAPLAPTFRAPAWFEHLVDPKTADIRIALPAGVVLALSAEPAADAGDAWVQFRNAVLVLGLVGGAALGLVHLTLRRALRPLDALTAAFRRVGVGAYDVRVPENGPAELARLSESFNLMAADLATMRRRTRLLEAQILKLQDEERAELARDLHDEIGPHLFAASIDASVARRALEERGDTDTAQRVGEVSDSISRVQRQVREILMRLRPTKLVEMGLEPAIEELVDFWRARRPQVRINASIDRPDGLSYALQELAYRTVQEGLTNAVRHARPGRIDVLIATGSGRRLQVQVADDGEGGDLSGPEAGLGLVGMRERAEALGGALTISRGPLGGWCVTVEAPIAEAPASLADG